MTNLRLVRIPRRRPAAHRERGQALVIFTIALVAIVSIAGLLIDGGMAWANRRQAQNGADTAALAAAKVYSATDDEGDAEDAAEDIAEVNGYKTDYDDCAGKKKKDGVEVNIPPTTGSHVGDDSYIEVFVRRPMRTSFSGVVGQPCWMVSARAVAVATSTEVASCNFCSLNNSNQNHTLILKNGAALRVDGDIHANSHNGGQTPGVCTPLTGHKVCGDGFDVFGDGGYISAKHITVVGGWETHDDNIVTADELAPGCGAHPMDHPNPPDQTEIANVCVHMPEIVDPLNDPANPGSVVREPEPGASPVPGSGGCPAGSVSPSGTAASAAQTKIISGNKTICPGTYYGGIQITGGTVTMLPGSYLMVGGGFQVVNSASVDGRAGVMIYATGSVGSGHSTTTANDLVPSPVPGKTTLKAADVVSDNNSSAPGESVNFTLTLTPQDSKGVLPGGYVDFYDGNVIICAASPLIRNQLTKNIVHADCPTTYNYWGSRAISAVYSGDVVYNAIGDTLSQTIDAPNNVKDGPITLQTTGKVDLHGPTSGVYAGVTIFQDRASNLTITLAPGDSRAGGCGGGFMKHGIRGDTHAIPDPCGDIGGLQGTIYAAHQNALVLIEASGMANLQVIAGEIQVDSDADARFGFKASVFANSSIHLVE